MGWEWETVWCCVVWETVWNGSRGVVWEWETGCETVGEWETVWEREMVWE